MSKLLKNKIIIVTGGSNGIGYYISKRILENGGIVIICARNKIRLKKSYEELKKISTNIYTYKLDISKLKKVKKFSKWVIKKFNHIDGLVNNAGIMGEIGNTIDLKIKDIKKTININLFGTINMINTFYPIFNKKERKKIINLSGGGSTGPLKNYSSYAISKISIVKLTENLSKELSNTDINAISPGFISTKIHNKTLNTLPNIVGEEYYNKTKQLIENGGESPYKSADLICYLLSKKSNNINGKLISAIWDNWNDDNFIKELKYDNDLCTLRRIDKKYFQKII